MSFTDSQAVQALVNRGIAYSTRSNPDDQKRAIADYDKVINNYDSNYVDAYISRGIAYSALLEPKHDEAIQDYNQAINISTNDNDANAYYALGFTLALQEENKQAAINAFQQAVELYREEGKQDYADSAEEQIRQLE